MDLSKIEDFVKIQLGGDNSGHDAFHCFRVRKTAEKLAVLENSTENINLSVIICAALLHDIADVKICKDVEQANKNTIDVMKESGVGQDNIEKVMEIISSLSYKGAGVDTTMATIEGKIVQDADRLDAIGAIGIARCFAYGGHSGNPMYNPDAKPVMHSSEEEYRQTKGSSISHFYEKLLLLKDRMQTKSGKAIAEKRHKYLENFLKQFLDEWDGIDIENTHLYA